MDSHFLVTGHFPTTAPNDPEMTLNTTYYYFKDYKAATPCISFKGISRDAVGKEYN